MFASHPTTLSSSLTHIELPRIDHAALDDAHRTRQARARLFQAGTRVWVVYRLNHQDHPYRPLFSPQQRTPLGEVCRYAGPGIMSIDYYDVESDQMITTAYHTVIDDAGHYYRVLADDLHCVDIAAPAAAVPATIPQTCRALQLAARMPHEPLRQVLMRLAAHITLIALTADRNLYISGDTLHVGPQRILRLPGGILVDDVVYPIQISLVSLRRLVKALRARLAASECARFLADLRRECRHLPGLAASLIPRDGTITVNSNRYPRLKISVTPGAVILAPYVSAFQQADGHRPAWVNRYRFSSPDLFTHIQEVLS